jgi:hypothetical protein
MESKSVTVIDAYRFEWSINPEAATLRFNGIPIARVIRNPIHREKWVIDYLHVISGSHPTLNAAMLATEKHFKIQVLSLPVGLSRDNRPSPSGTAVRRPPRFPIPQREEDDRLHSLTASERQPPAGPSPRQRVNRSTRRKPSRPSRPRWPRRSRSSASTATRTSAS